MNTRFFLSLAAAALLLPLSPTVAQRPAKAAAEPTISLTRRQVSTFQSAFTTLANKTHLTFVAEAQPLKTTLDPNAPLDLKDGGEPLSVTVAKVAAAYDYDAQRQGNVFLLKKRFTDPADLPDVTLAECAATARDVLTLIDGLSPHLPVGAVEDDPSIRAFLTSLSPEQIKLIADHSEGLPVAAMPPVQQEAVQKIVLYMYVQQPAFGLDFQTAHLERTAKGDPYFYWRDLPGAGSLTSVPHVFGFTVPTGEGRHEQFTPLGRPGLLTPDPNGSLTITRDPKAEAVKGLPADPTDPPKKAKRQPKEADLSLTLSQIVVTLNARKGIGPPMLVDAALAPKHVTIFNADAAPPAVLLQALADIYGLRVRTQDDGTQVLARHARRIPLNFAGLSQAVRQAIPDPLLRASETIGKGNPSPLRVEAVKELRTAAEPKMEKDFNKRVALSELSDREKTALADALMANLMAQWNGAFGPTLPSLLARYSEARLIGGPYKDKESGSDRFELQVCLPNDTKYTTRRRPLTGKIGIGNMVYVPPAP